MICLQGDDSYISSLAAFFYPLYFSAIETWFLLLPLLVTQVGLAQTRPLMAFAPPRVADNLKAPEGQVVMLKALARGVQIYECKVKPDNPNQFEWILKAAQADLFDNKGKKIGKHYAGPTWEANDGSKVVGEVKARAKAPNPSAIPWLLLQAKSQAGDGMFSKVTYIQRVDTVAGIAPAQKCD
jgi:hypothetical protein